MKVIRHTDRNFASTLQQLAAASILFDATVEARARAIVEAVQSRGDEAVCEFTERFDGAKVAAAQLSNRYITDRFLPDKAIDLIDEAAAKLRTEMESMPEELESLERRLMQLEIEREALKKEKDEASRDRLGSLEKQIAEEHLAREVYDPVYGARPLKRFLQRAIETPLSRQLISGEITDHTRVTIEFKNGKLTFAATSIKGVK